MSNDPTPSKRFRIRPWELLTAAGAMACIPTLLAFLGAYSWFLDLFSHFRVQYMLGLLVFSVLLLVGRRYKTAGVFLAFACVNATFVLPLYIGRQSPPAEATATVRAMLLNVHTQRGDPERVREVVLAEAPAILVLQEISQRWISDLDWIGEIYPYTRTHPREDHFGIGLFSKWPIVESEIVNIADFGIPSILATLRVQDIDVQVMGTHPLPPISRATSQGRNEQLKRLPEYLQTQGPTLLLGDLNVTPWNHHFRKLLTRSGLRDSAKGFGVQPTWPNFNPFLRIPIDHCLHSKEIVIVDRKIGEDVASDHFPLIVDFVIALGRAEQGAMD